jgi:hypothetical protein
MAAGIDQLHLAAASSSLKKLQGGRLGPTAGPDTTVTTEFLSLPVTQPAGSHSVPVIVHDEQQY